MSIPGLLNFKQLITFFPKASYTDAVEYMGLVSIKTMVNAGMTKNEISNVYRKFEHDKERMKKEIAADKARMKMLEKLEDTNKLRGAIADSKIKENNDFMKSYHEMKAKDDLEFLSEYEDKGGFDEMDKDDHRGFLSKYEDTGGFDGGKRRKKSCRKKRSCRRKKSFRRKRSRT